MSSRLFQEIRETRGLAYSIYSSVDTFADAGALSVYTACQPDRFAEVAAVTTEVLEEVARDGITAEECRIAKELAARRIGAGARGFRLADEPVGPYRVELRRHRPIARTLRELSAVTLDEVNAVARELLRQPYGVAVLGPYRSKGALPRRLRSMAG